MTEEKKISQLNVWDSVNDMVVLVDTYSAKTDRNGNIINTFIFSDATGRIPGVLWSEPLPVRPGNIVVISGVVGYFNGPQIQVESIKVVPPEDANLFMDKVMSSSKLTTKELQEKVLEIINKIPDDSIREFTTKAIEEIPDFFRAPAGKRIHHAWIGGLAEHSIGVATIVAETMYRYNVSHSVAIAGALLHDIGKTKELEINGLIDYSDTGKLCGHMFLGAKMLYDIAHSNSCRITEKVLEDLTHIILSHHGELEYGAVVKPCTKEALLVYLADKLDATMVAAEELIRRDNNVHSNWTTFDNVLQISMRK